MLGKVVRGVAFAALGAVARPIGFMVGVALVFNGTMALVDPKLDASVWLVDLRGIPDAARAGVCLGAGVMLIVASVITRNRLLRVAGMVAALGVGGIAAKDSVVYQWLRQTGRIESALPIAWSMLLAAGMVVVVIDLARRDRPMGSWWRVFSIGWGICLAPAFLLSQIVMFGATTYERRCDAIVVFGARTYADGQPSLALADRVRTAAGLYRRGLARLVIVTGGPGDGAVHECEAMAELACQLGVPRSAILQDREGLNTFASVQHVSEMGHERGVHRVLAVSHFYHLARIKLTFERAGMETYTVPAEETRALARTPWFVARETAALGYYFVRTLGS